MPRKQTLKIVADYYSVPLDWLTSDNTAASLVSEDELDLLGMFRRLPNVSRYKVLGYVERMCVEESSVDEYHY